MSSLASVPKEIIRSAERGELQKVVKWLRKGGHVDALCSWEGEQGRSRPKALLHAAAAHGQLAQSAPQGPEPWPRGRRAAR